MKHSLFGAFAAVGICLALPIRAQATTVKLATPLIASPQTNPVIDCAITNVGDKPVTVTATVFDFSGSDVSQPADPTACPSLTLAPDKSCIIQGKFSGTPALGFCKFTASSNKVRAVGHGEDPVTGVISSIPATTK